MPKYRKKPVIVEAEQYRPGLEDGTVCTKTFCGFINSVPTIDCGNLCGEGNPYINTLEGIMFISPGDWIVTGSEGEKYLYKNGIFLQTYEPV